MEDLKNPILVPWDFSPKSETALMHAVKFSQIIDKGITLLNIVKRDKDIESATEDLVKRAETCLKECGVRPSVLVKVGSIFTTITEVVSELNVTMAIMGTHGVKGMQKLTGSWALKVILGSDSPFLVVQAPPQDKPISNIVLPLDFRVEKKEVLVWANYLATFYKTRVHLAYQEPSDSGFKKKTHSNILVSQKYLSEKGIDFEIHKLPNKSGLSGEIVDYSKSIGNSLILIMTSKGIQNSDFIFGADEQKMIANEDQIPILVVNPRTDLRKFSHFGV